MVALVKQNTPFIAEKVIEGRSSSDLAGKPPSCQFTTSTNTKKPFRKITADPPGLYGPVELSVTDRWFARPMTTAWISEGLLARMIDVWSRAYGRPVTTQEAMEILMNVKRFTELLTRAK